MNLLPAILVGEKNDPSSALNQELFLGYMDQEALRRTRETGRVVLFSVARMDYWEKGALSGNGQIVEEIYFDDTTRTIVLKVRNATNDDISAEQ